jgi:hypothetical protein
MICDAGSGMIAELLMGSARHGTELNASASAPKDNLRDR